MYSLTSLQMIQTNAKLSNTSALMLIYNGLEDPNTKQDQIEESINKNGIWSWLKENTTPEMFASMRVQACLHNELYIFDINVEKNILKKDHQLNWTSTIINKDGTLN